MNLTPNETAAVLWAFGILLSVLAFIGALGVKALIGMAKDLNEIKTAVKAQSIKHEDLENRVGRIEDKIFA